MATYIALVRQEDTSSYGVSFPDFPGLVSGGETMEEAMENAPQGLAFHIAGMLEDGEKVPAPSPLSEIMADQNNSDARAVLIEAPSAA
ncbi:MAG TPA: type II toxin-antitoxin system HicB family antitoxin [Alphaproteobacteria bacterium]|nr:type II toxin-antitoxin system HicB family antitoxin [Alphaproteobacteria bacterium]